MLLAIDRVRPFHGSRADYKRMLDCWAMCWPLASQSIDEQLAEDQMYADLACHRYFYYWRSNLVAFGELSQTSWSASPHSYSMILIVNSRYRRQGIGSYVYDHLLKIDVDVPIKMVEVGTTSLQSDAHAFAVARGFHLGTREYVSRLDLNEVGVKFERKLQNEIKNVSFLSWNECLQRGF